MSHEPGFNLRRKEGKGDLVMVWKAFNSWLSDRKRKRKEDPGSRTASYTFIKSTPELQHMTLEGAADLGTEVTSWA